MLKCQITTYYIPIDYVTLCSNLFFCNNGLCSWSGNFLCNFLNSRSGNLLFVFFCQLNRQETPQDAKLLQSLCEYIQKLTFYSP